MTDPITIIVCGSRSEERDGLIMQWLDDYASKVNIDILIQGGAGGADKIAKDWADYRGVPYMNVPADWDKLGRPAGPIRNKLMANFAKRLGLPVVCVAFPGGPGTESMVRIATESQFNVIRVSL